MLAICKKTYIVIFKNLQNSVQNSAISDNLSVLFRSLDRDDPSDSRQNDIGSEDSDSEALSVLITVRCTSTYLYTVWYPGWCWPILDLHFRSHNTCRSQGSLTAVPKFWNPNNFHINPASRFFAFSVMTKQFPEWG